MTDPALLQIISNLDQERFQYDYLFSGFLSPNLLKNN